MSSTKWSPLSVVVCMLALTIATTLGAPNGGFKKSGSDLDQGEASSPASRSGATEVPHAKGSRTAIGAPRHHHHFHVHKKDDCERPMSRVDGAISTKRDRNYTTPFPVYKSEGQKEEDWIKVEPLSRTGVVEARETTTDAPKSRSSLTKASSKAPKATKPPKASSTTTEAPSNESDSDSNEPETDKPSSSSSANERRETTQKAEPKPTRPATDKISQRQEDDGPPDNDDDDGRDLSDEDYTDDGDSVDN